MAVFGVSCPIVAEMIVCPATILSVLWLFYSDVIAVSENVGMVPNALPTDDS